MAGVPKRGKVIPSQSEAIIPSRSPAARPIAWSFGAIVFLIVIGASPLALADRHIEAQPSRGKFSKTVLNGAQARAFIDGRIAKTPAAENRWARQRSRKKQGSSSDSLVVTRFIRETPQPKTGVASAIAWLGNLLGGGPLRASELPKTCEDLYYMSGPFRGGATVVPASLRMDGCDDVQEVDQYLDAYPSDAVYQGGVEFYFALELIDANQSTINGAETTFDMWFEVELANGYYQADPNSFMYDAHTNCLWGGYAVDTFLGRSCNDEHGIGMAIIEHAFMTSGILLPIELLVSAEECAPIIEGLWMFVGCVGLTTAGAELPRLMAEIVALQMDYVLDCILNWTAPEPSEGSFFALPRRPLAALQY